LLRPFGRQQFLNRLPLFLVTGVAFLFITVIALPGAVPRLFEHYLGHSITRLIVRQLSGDQPMLESWFTYWRASVEAGFRYVTFASAIWAMVNLVRKEAVRPNIVTILVSFGWLCFFVWTPLGYFPF